MEGDHGTQWKCGCVSLSARNSRRRVLPAAAIFVETTIHPDGSCDRTIWQPKDAFLPEALKPEWNARWKTVLDANGRPGKSDSRASKDDCKYFIARGSFNSPREIPPHYHFADEEVPDAGASELERSYARTTMGLSSNTAGRRRSRTS